jgi:transposase
MVSQASEKTVIAYLDECGISPIPPNRGAWAEVGECHLIPAIRGKQLNVMGALLSNGKFFKKTYWETTTAEIFLDFVKSLQIFVGKSVELCIVLDNASIHKAKLIQPELEVLNKENVKFYFLPPYSPELNRIERFWHMMKYTWLQVKHRTSQTLIDDVEEIFTNFGIKYIFPFFRKKLVI